MGLTGGRSGNAAALLASPTDRLETIDGPAHFRAVGVLAPWPSRLDRFEGCNFQHWSARLEVRVSADVIHDRRGYAQQDSRVRLLECLDHGNGLRRRPDECQAAVRPLGLRSGGRRHGDQAGQRLLPLRQRHLARQHADPRRQAGREPATGDDRPHRATPARHHGGGGAWPSFAHLTGRQGGRVLSVLHGRGAHRCARRQGDRAAARCGARGQHARRAGRPDGSHQYRLRRRPVQSRLRCRPQGPEALRGLRQPGGPWPAGSRLLPQARVRQAEGGLPGLCRAVAQLGRLA